MSGRVTRSKAARSRSRSRSRDRLPPGARYVNDPRVSRVPPHIATKLIHKFSSIPVYAIYGHSCIPVETGETGRTTAFGDEFAFSFVIPKNTFIMSVSDPGSATCMDRNLDEPIVQSHVNHIRQYFYLHGPDEFRDFLSGSLFGTATRATGGGPGKPIPYPNVAYAFTADIEGTAPDKNQYGVYDISTGNPELLFNNQSIIPQFNEKLPKTSSNRENWPLEDIIKRVYQVTGNRSAIFLSLGCYTTCRKSGYKRSMDKATDMMQYADIMYRDIIPVLSRADMRKNPVLRNQTHARKNPTWATLDTVTLEDMLKNPDLYAVPDPREVGWIFPVHDDDIKKVGNILVKAKEARKAQGLD